MDAGGLAKDTDLLSAEQCALLPISALRKQIAMREAYFQICIPPLQFRLDTVLIRDILARAEAKAVSTRVGTLKLELTHGTFAVLTGPGTVATCYTDDNHNRTSRSAEVSPEALLAFARSVIALLDPEESVKAA